MRLQYVPADNPSVDPEWQILRHDGTPTGYAIQDCRAYRGGFAVNRCTPDSVTFLGVHRSLKAAFLSAMELMS